MNRLPVEAVLFSRSVLDEFCEVVVRNDFVVAEVATSDSFSG